VDIFHDDDDENIVAELQASMEDVSCFQISCTIQRMVYIKVFINMFSTILVK